MPNHFEIDYSGLLAPELKDTGWEAPPHKYFGRRDPNTGKMESEPVYVYQEYPRMFYALREGKIVAAVVNSDAEREALGQGWEKTPAKFGYIGAPTLAEANIIKAARDAEAENKKSTLLVREAPKK